MSGLFPQSDDLPDQAGLTKEIVIEILERIRKIQLEGGFGSVTIVIKNDCVYKIDHTVHGKPTIVKKGGDIN